MAKALHSSKLEAEKNVFVNELFQSLPERESLIGTGPISARAKTLHSIFLPIYIMKRYMPDGLKTNYADVIFTYAIESECLLIAGFKNAAQTMLRGLVEAAIKFVYYEYHPIENIAHHQEEQTTKVSGIEYREFVYIFPGLKDISFFKRENFEALWAELCKSVHVNLRSIENLSIVADMESALKKPENDFQALISLLKKIQKVVVAMLFSVRSDWAAEMEKALFDTIWGDFAPEERTETQRLLQIE